MSRLCRLKTKSHGEDGLWAYQEITTLRAKVAELEAKLAKYENLEPVAWVCVNEDGECLQIDYGSESPLPGYDGFIPLYALEMK